MRKSIRGSNRRRRWTGTAAMVLTVALVAVVSQGCCSWCIKHCNLPETHAIAFAVDLDTCPCPDADCVCFLPDRIKLKRGDSIRIINRSQFAITLSASEDGVFEGGDNFTVNSGDVTLLKIRSNAPTGQLGINYEVAPPGRDCDGLPGPIIDID